MLTENQAILFIGLQHLQDGFTTMPRLSKTMGIPVGTLRSCLRRLRDIGLATSHVDNIAGQNGLRVTINPRPFALRGDSQQFRSKLAQINFENLSMLQPSDPGIESIPHHMSRQVSHHVSRYTSPQMSQHVDHQPISPLSSSSNKLLQKIVFEDAFQDLNPRSLMPLLEQFDTTADLQDFLDIANACIAAAKEGHGKPIKNPHGFLFAQLRQGYINPPEGYKSRRVRAQEIRNQQLKAEIATLQKLEAQENELRFEMFKVKLTEDDLARLEEDARKQVNRKIGLSTERQIEVNKEDILKQRFAQQKDV